MGTLDDSKEVAVDEPNVGLVEVTALPPHYVFRTVPIQKGAIVLVYAFVRHEVLISQDQDWTLDLLLDNGLSEGEEPRIQEHQVRNLGLEFRLKVVVGLEGNGAAVRMGH
jgi:hypothetical protein